MKRELKFRIWDKEKKEFYEPIFEGYKGRIYELLLTMHGEIIRRTIDRSEHESIFPDRYVIMQYTGLEDKNGKEIYEGDILQHNNPEKDIGIVKFGGLPINKPGDCTCSYQSFYLSTISDKYFDCEPIENYLEIIGNIYENPELLNDLK